MKAKKVKVKLIDWHYQCGDGCCDMYGTEIEVNGVKCDNQYAGDDVELALTFLANQIGKDIEIEREYES